MLKYEVTNHIVEEPLNNNFFVNKRYAGTSSITFEATFQPDCGIDQTEELKDLEKSISAFISKCKEMGLHR